MPGNPEAVPEKDDLSIITKPFIIGIVMNENQGQAEGIVTRPPKAMDDDIRKSITEEILEMEKYKWYLGVQLQHDPLQDRSLNDIYCEWIDKYAADFRKLCEIYRARIQVYRVEKLPDDWCGVWQHSEK